MKYIIVFMSLIFLLGNGGCDNQEYDQEIRKQEGN